MINIESKLLLHGNGPKELKLQYDATVCRKHDKGKKITKEWNKVHKAQMQKYLKEIEEKIESMFHGNEEGVFSEVENLKMKYFKKKKENTPWPYTFIFFLKNNIW